MRWAVVVAIGMVPPIALAEDLLPKRPGFNRYQAVLNRSFAIPSVVPTATSGLAKDLYIAEIAWRDKGCAVTVTLRSATDKDFKKELPAKRSGQTKCSDERDFSNIYLDLRP